PPAPGGGGQPTLLGQFGEWGAYTANSGGKKICYALAKPSSSATEPNRPRDPAYTFISTRPTENVRNEISIVIGYPFKAGYDASPESITTKLSESHGPCKIALLRVMDSGLLATLGPGMTVWRVRLASLMSETDDNAP